MDQILQFLPEGPNFSPFSSAAGAVQFVLSIILGAIALWSFGGFIINLFRYTASTARGRPDLASEHKGSMLGSLFICIGVVVGWGMVMAIIAGVANGFGTDASTAVGVISTTFLAR